MKVLVAVDKFKGSLTGVQANAAVARAVARAQPQADGDDLQVIEVPIADGGDGTLAAALVAGFSWQPVRCSGPTGEPVDSGFGLRGEGESCEAVIELADCCGLLRLPVDEGGRPQLAAEQATTKGLGEMMVAALDAGARRLVIGLGGSASTDGGWGMLQVLGLDQTGGSDARLGLDARLAQTEIVVATDVDNPLLGERGAAAVFGPQKGLTPAQVERAEAQLRALADHWEPVLGRVVRDLPGAGAAGGAGWGLMLVGGQVRPGIEVVLDWTQARAAIAEADLVITGEGSLDEQTLAGKAPIGVARLAQAAGVPVLAISGRRLLTDEQVAAAGFADAIALTEIEGSTQRCMTDAERLLERATEQVVARRRWA